MMLCHRARVVIHAEQVEAVDRFQVIRFDEESTECPGEKRLYTKSFGKLMCVIAYLLEMALRSIQDPGVCTDPATGSLWPCRLLR